MDIIVKSQKELDTIPVDTKDTIIIEFGTYESPAHVTKYYTCLVKVYGNSHVEAYDNSSVEACGNASVVAYDNSSVIACGNSSVEACGNSSIEVYENASVVAYDNSSVIACGNSSVIACGNSSVIAHGNSHVEAYDNSSIEVYENASVVAYYNSSVIACNNSSVWAYNDSSVIACGNAQVIDFLQRSTIDIYGNARVVYMPKNIEEFIDFYGIDHDETTATFFKAVHKKKINDAFEYVSDYDSDFKYEIGKKVISNKFNIDPNKTCGQGIHVSHKNWALNFGKKMERFSYS